MAQVQDIAKYFLYLDDTNEGDGISNLKLQKLVYYAQGFFSALFDKPLFDNPILAWRHGPVITELYHAYKQYGKNPIPLPADFDASSLTKDEKELIGEVSQEFGQFSAWKLRNMTHEETPWIDYEKEADTIPFDELTHYFKTRV
ncbi:MAG: SocA family protein [Algicola sp.]|nr:SocA family protein [Algicola sp.]